MQHSSTAQQTVAKMIVKSDYNLHDVRIYCKAVSLDCIRFKCYMSANCAYMHIFFSSAFRSIIVCACVCALCVHDQSWAYNRSSEKGVAERRQAVSALICLLTVQPYFAAEYSY